ncbi:hypothetical protein C8R44DRAFT_731942 [Mycena epipterygia]|nr:hypothetical protein C8R44DRAFT_731942 [Mycena epipterygia]
MQASFAHAAFLLQYCPESFAFFLAKPLPFRIRLAPVGLRLSPTNGLRNLAGSSPTVTSPWRTRFMIQTPYYLLVIRAQVKAWHPKTTVPRDFGNAVDMLWIHISQFPGGLLGTGASQRCIKPRGTALRILTTISHGRQPHQDTPQDARPGLRRSKHRDLRYIKFFALLLATAISVVSASPLPAEDSLKRGDTPLIAREDSALPIAAEGEDAVAAEGTIVLAIRTRKAC